MKTCKGEKLISHNLCNLIKINVVVYSLLYYSYYHYYFSMFPLKILKKRKKKILTRLHSKIKSKTLCQRWKIEGPFLVKKKEKKSPVDYFSLPIDQTPQNCSTILKSINSRRAKKKGKKIYEGRRKKKNEVFARCKHIGPLSVSSWATQWRTVRLFLKLMDRGLFQLLLFFFFFAKIVYPCSFTFLIFLKPLDEFTPLLGCPSCTRFIIS